MTCFTPAPSYAYEFDSPRTIDTTTGEVCPGEGFTKRIVYCVKETIVTTTWLVLYPFIQYLSNTVAAAITLAIVLWGILMLTGKNTAPIRDLFVMLLKIGGVTWFMREYLYYFPVMLDSMGYMVDAVTGYIALSPSLDCGTDSNLNPGMLMWDRVDCVLESLIGGIISPFTIYSGIGGFLIACLFSGPIGIFIGLIGLYMIVLILIAIARATYIFITAYIAFSLMSIIGALIIPLILFRVTKPYFDKWLRLTFGFMLQPIFLFAFLTMMLAAFDSAIYSGNNSFYRAMTGNTTMNDVPAFRSNGGIGNWMLSRGVYKTEKLGNYAINFDPKKLVDLLKCNRYNQTCPLGPNNPQALDTGTLGNVAEVVTDPQNWQTDIYSTMLKPNNFFDVKAEVTKVDFATAALYSHDDWQTIDVSTPELVQDLTNTYLLKLLLSAILAMVTAYIFMTMLDFLPFIGSGLSGDVLSMPPLGVGQFSMPGSQLVGNLKNKIAGNFFK